MRDVRRLADRLAGATSAWYAARPHGAAARAELLRALVLDLAALGVRAGTGQPPDAVPPDLGHHALADQLVVLAHELTTAPAAAAVLPEAIATVRTLRNHL